MAVGAVGGPGWEPGSDRAEWADHGRRGHSRQDALLETWQADPQVDTSFRGFGRVAVDFEGRYELLTLKPGPIADGQGSHQAPHIDVSVFARGLLQRCVTRIYFADERAANAADLVLCTVPAERRNTLLARPVEGGYRFDVCLQGSDETVFFDI